MKTEIRHKVTGKVLFWYSGDLKAAVVAAVKNKINLHEAYLREVDLSGVDFSGADLGWIDFSKACFNEADLRGTDFSGSCLSGVDFSGVDFRGSCLSRAILSGACFRGTDLSGSDLSGTYLNGVDFSGACLRGVNFHEADLSGAYFSGVNGEKITINNPPVQLDGLRYEVTIWDDHMQVGCEFHLLSDWWSFDDREILEMDEKKALEWWRIWKEPLKLICFNNGRGVEEWPTEGV